MPRPIRHALLALTAAAAVFPATAGAAVSSDVVDGTLVVSGDVTVNQLALAGTKASLQVVAGKQRLEVARSRFSRVLVRTGAGDDVVQVDGSAAVPELTIEGEQGLDTVRLPGSAESEEITVQAVGDRARISRDVSPARVELATVEIADVGAGAGQDLVDVGNLAGSGLQRVNADLGAGDGARDQVAAQGSAANEFIDARPAGGGAMSVFGLPGGASVGIKGSSAPDDGLTLSGLGGRDSLTAIAVPTIAVTLDGGEGPDTLTGSDAAEVLRGGPGNDSVLGGDGDDAIDLGDGDDGTHWNAGDGSDTLEGGAGADTLSLRGSTAADTVEAAADNGRARITHNGTAAVIDGDDVEQLDTDLHGGADRVSVGHLTGADLVDIDADVGAGDNATDEVTVAGTAGDDEITAVGAAVSGLAALVAVSPAEPRDKLSIQALDGEDSVDTTGVPAIGVRILADGGAGDDVLLCGAGDDVLLGGAGADVAFAGGGDDVALGGAGDDVLRGEAGDDVLDGGPDDDVLLGNAGDDVLLNGEVVFDD